MRIAIGILAAILITFALAPKADAADRGFLFGTITTESGDKYTGRIRWDKNEGFWDDLLNATKYDDERYEDIRPRGRSRVSLFGIEILSNGTFQDWNSTSQLQFGNIESILPRSRGRAVVLLKNGEKVRFEDSGTDIGSDNRGIQVFLPDQEVVELEWGEIDKVDFFPEPDDYKIPDPNVERLYGRVVTEGGEEYAGFIAWDADEIYSSDILDGDEEGRERKIPMGTIESITKAGSDACRVRTKSGREMRLDNSNDVDSGLRGIQISMPNIGQVEVEWDEFESITFLPIPTGVQPTYDRFDGGKPLHGIVTDEDGNTFSGTIAWDNDERYTWEFLDGEMNRVQYNVEFSRIASIERRSSRSATVTLRDGTVLDLRGSNDVDDECRGIFIETATGLEVLEWDEFEKVVFD